MAFQYFYEVTFIYQNLRSFNMPSNATKAVKPIDFYHNDNRLMREVINGFTNQLEVWRLLKSAIRQVQNLKVFSSTDTDFNESREMGAFVDQIWEALTRLDKDCTRRFQAEQDLWMKHLDNPELAGKKIEFIRENRRALGEWRITGSNGIAINAEHRLQEALDACIDFFEILFDLLRRCANAMSEPAWDEFLYSTFQTIAARAAKEVATNARNSHHTHASRSAFQLCKSVQR
jgi:hypothetical protein